MDEKGIKLLRRVRKRVMNENMRTFFFEGFSLKYWQDD
jgi:hypothetical protein